MTQCDGDPFRTIRNLIIVQLATPVRPGTPARLAGHLHAAWLPSLEGDTTRDILVILPDSVFCDGRASAISWLEAQSTVLGAGTYEVMPGL